MNQATTPPTQAERLKTTDAKEAAPTKAKKEKKEPKVRVSKFATLYPENAIVTLLVESNPKKEGSKSRERFEGYTGAATVGAALAAGVTYQDIAYDVGRQFISVKAA